MDRKVYRGAGSPVAQICNLVYCGIPFCSSFHLKTVPSRFQIGDTARGLCVRFAQDAWKSRLRVAFKLDCKAADAPKKSRHNACWQTFGALWFKTRAQHAEPTTIGIPLCKRIEFVGNFWQQADSSCFTWGTRLCTRQKSNPGHPACRT
jgi:hypothetical protein